MAAVSLSADSQAIALLCSALALSERSEVKPLSPTEWNELAARIQRSSLQRPGELIGKSEGEIASELAVPPELARRVEALLGRGGQLAFELERLSSRGFWLLTRADDDYPVLLKRRLRGRAPPVLFGAGSRSLVNQPGLAVVGSRDADADALAFAEGLGRRAAREGLSVVSGAARGIDITGMLACIDTGGTAVGVLADSLEKTAQLREFREALVDGNLTLVTSYHPSARFNVGNAMRRNAFIYCLSRLAVVVASTADKGGTTAGALENLKAQWVPLFVRDDGSAGNAALIKAGGRPLPADLGEIGEPFAAALAREPSNAALLVEDEDGETQDESDTPEGDSRASGSLDRAPASQLSDSASDGALDAFSLVWPHLAAFLAQERTEKQVAEHFRLEPSQARAWLRRAVEERRVDRLEKRRCYVVALGQSSLWEER